MYSPSVSFDACDASAFNADTYYFRIFKEFGAISFSRLLECIRRQEGISMAISAMKCKSNSVVHRSARANFPYSSFIGKKFRPHSDTMLKLDVFMKLLPLFFVVCDEHITRLI